MIPKELSIVGELLLDPKNPRHPEITSQAELVQHFSRDNRTYTLAKDILENGLSPIESLMVFQDGDDYIVLEGNRRTAAVKLLNNPDLAATASRANKFKELMKGNTFKIPKRAACIVAPDRSSASLWLTRRHGGRLAGIGTVPWGAIQRERFDVALGNPGQYPLAMAVLDGLALTISDDFPISIFSRLIKNPKVRKKLGISLKDEELVIKSNKSKIKKILKSIVSDIDAGEIGTARIETSELQIKILNDTITGLGIDLGDEGSDQEADDDGTGVGKDEKSGKKTSEKSPKPRSTVAPKNFKPVPVHAKTLKILNELKAVNVNRHPISSAGAFRAFIEIAGLGYRQKKTGKKHDKKTKLDAVLGDINKYMMANSILGASDLKRLNQFKSSLDNPTSKDALNATLHNPQYTVDPESLRTAWDDMTPFISKLLDEI